MDRKWLAIGQIAKRSGVNASALRFYEQKGLIQSLRSEGGRRLYPQDALRRIAFIRVAQGMGLSLDEIAGALTGLPDGRTPDRLSVARAARSANRDLAADEAQARRLHRLRLPLAGALRPLQPGG